MQKVSRKPENLVFVFGVLLLGIAARLFLFPVESNDYLAFLTHWVRILRENGGFRAVGIEIGDYTPGYYYVLAFLSYLPIRDLFGIKVVSCLGDVVMAYLVGKIVTELTDSEQTGVFAFAAAFFLPSAALNSAAWAQCDVLYTSFLLASFLALLRGKDWKAMIFFGCAFALKLQAVFFAPLLALLTVKGKIRLRTAAAVPGVYLVSVLPAVAAGGNLLRLLTVYVRQSGQYSSLNMNVPNVWAFFESLSSDELSSAGVMLAGGVLLAVLYAFFLKISDYDKDTLLCLAAFFLIAVPFVLPHMHERYYYPAEIFALIFAFRYRRKFWVPAVAQYLAVQVYLPFLYGIGEMDLRLLTVGTVAWMTAVVRELTSKTGPTDYTIRIEI